MPDKCCVHECHEGEALIFLADGHNNGGGVLRTLTLSEWQNTTITFDEAAKGFTRWLRDHVACGFYDALRKELKEE